MNKSGASAAARATAVLLGLAGLSNASHAQVPAYGELELQARSNLIVNDEGWNLPPGSSFNSITASINAEGWVSFPVQVVPVAGQTGSSAGIWRGRHGVGAIVARHDPIGSGEVSVSDRAAINADGHVGYIVNRDFSAYSIWRYDPVADASSQVNLFPLTPAFISNVALSDAGVVGFQGRFGASGRGLASTVPGAQPPDSVIHVADNTINPGSPYVYLYSPAMNNARVIAGKVNVGDLSHAEIRLFTAGGDSTLLVQDRASDPASPFQGFDNGLAVNDAGQVAVALGLADGGGRAVYRFEVGEKPVRIARVGEHGITAIESFAPAINASGLIAFRGRTADGQAIFVGDGGGAPVRAVGKGDTLMTDLGPGRIGQHIDNPTSWPVFSGGPGINDHGDIVAVAGLHPDGNTQVEWGSGVIVAWAGVDDPIFADGFEPAPPAL
jgi:hypothetical protein